mgnify:CR=1 FL=1
MEKVRRTELKYDDEMGIDVTIPYETCDYIVSETIKRSLRDEIWLRKRGSAYTMKRPTYTALLRSLQWYTNDVDYNLFKAEIEDAS